MAGDNCSERIRSVCRNWNLEIARVNVNGSMAGGMRNPSPTISSIEKFDCYKINRRIGNKFNNTVEIFEYINDDDVNMNVLVESAMKFVC